MDCRANSDAFFLSDEKFDFDVSLSPASSKGDEDEDEVFLGPVSHKEKCVSVNVASQLEDCSSGMRMSWSPLTGDQLDAVCQEAHRLATQLQSSEPSQLETINTTTDTAGHREEFVQDTQAKLDVLGQTASVLSPIKRQTFCVQDSPMKQLPPAVQRRLVRGSNAGRASITGPAATTRAPSTRNTTANTALATRPAARLSTSSPVVRAKAQPRMALRGKAALGVSVVLPSKPAPPQTSSSASKRVDKTRLHPPSKLGVASGRRSPSSGPSSRAESYEDLLSDSTSVASDLSDSSLNSSQLGKRALAPPTKNVVRNLSGVKAPPVQNRRVADRKNTSSSSSSVSSFNSSMSLSPAKGKLNCSLNQSLSGSAGPAPRSINKPANPSRPRRSTVYTAAEPASSTTSRRSMSTQARKVSDADRVKAVRSTPLKRAEATPSRATPVKRGMERTNSVPPVALVRPQSGLKAKAKPEAQVVPTPIVGARGVHGDGISKTLKPKRLVSVGSMDSLSQKPSASAITPTAGGCKSLQMKARRPSALPTPVRHRMSAIVTPTPSTLTRATKPSPPSTDAATGSGRKEGKCSPAPVDMLEDEPVEVSVIQPFSLEEEEPPAVTPCSPPQPNEAEERDPGAPTQGQSEPTKNLIELETTEEIKSKAQEVLLLDLPAPALQPQEKLLIDLTNTPDLIRTGSKACTTTQQLIDLSSPLIKWSPEDKKENNAPLINLSF